MTEEPEWRSSLSYWARKIDRIFCLHEYHIIFNGSSPKTCREMDIGFEYHNYYNASCISCGKTKKIREERVTSEQVDKEREFSRNNK